MRILAFAALTLVGCSAGGGANSHGSTGGAPSDQPLVCDQITDRVGTYLLHFERQSGDCGDPPDSLVRVGADIGENCALDAPDLWSNNGCTLDRAITCTDDNGPTTVVGVTTQQDATGERITGIVTITVRDAAGNAECIGTYRITYTRQ